MIEDKLDEIQRIVGDDTTLIMLDNVTLMIRNEIIETNRAAFVGLLKAANELSTDIETYRGGLV